MLGIITIVLFVLPFATRRRFGTLGLALAAGSLLSSLWSHDVTRLVNDMGVSLTAPPLESIVIVVLTVLPALLVLHGSPSYHSSIPRLLGSGLFAFMGIGLLLTPLEAGLIIEGSGRAVYDFLLQNQTIIVTIGLVAAVADIFFTKVVKSPRLHGKH